MKIKIVSGFPATGKSYYTEQSLKKFKFIISDSDSSRYSWIRKGERNPNFPNNYIQHIKQIIGTRDFIFVSSHEIVRNALVKEKIPFILVYPHISLKNEYIQRLTERGNNDLFIQLISDNWELWIRQLWEQKSCFHIELKSNEYISTIIEEYFTIT